MSVESFPGAGIAAGHPRYLPPARERRDADAKVDVGQVTKSAV